MIFHLFGASAWRNNKLPGAPNALLIHHHLLLLVAASLKRRSYRSLSVRVMLSEEFPFSPDSGLYGLSTTTALCAGQR